MADRRREWWWITSEPWKVTEPVPALVSYFEDTPCLVEAAGAEDAFSADDCKLIERIFPPGAANNSSFDPGAGIMSRDEAVLSLGTDWRKIAASIDAIRVEKDGSLTSVPAGA